MKGKHLVAFFLFMLGSAKIIDWFVFCEKNRQLKSENYEAFKIRYVAHFPDWLKPLFNSRPEIAATISVALFVIAGFLFLKAESMFFRVLAIVSFLLAFWNLFSIM